MLVCPSLTWFSLPFSLFSPSIFPSFRSFPPALSEVKQKAASRREMCIEQFGDPEQSEEECSYSDVPPLSPSVSLPLLSSSFSLSPLSLLSPSLFILKGEEGVKQKPASRREMYIEQ